MASLRFLLFLAVLLCSPHVIWAQMDKGDLLFGGSFLFSSQEIEISVSTPGFVPLAGSQTTISGQPRVGYFITDDVAAGVFGILSKDETSFTDYFATGPNSREDFRRLSSTYIFGAFSRFYLPLEGDRAAIFLHGELGFGNSFFSATVQDSALGPIRTSEQPETFVTNFGVGLGFVLFASKRVGAEAGLLYRSNSSTYNSSSSAAEVTELYTGFEFQLGISLHLSTTGQSERRRPPTRGGPRFN